MKCVPFDGEVTVFWVCEELNQLHYQGWYEVVSEPPTYTMVVSRQQARVRRLVNGTKYKFKVVAVNEVGRSESSWSEEVVPNPGAMKAEYQREKKRIACVMKEMLLEERKKRAKEETSAKVASFELKRREVLHLEEEKARKAVAKKMARKRKREDERMARERKKEEERMARKRKMEEQRAKVLANKRRISILSRERVDMLASQWGRGGVTAMSMAQASRKKAPTRKAYTGVAIKRPSKAAPKAGSKKKKGT